MYAGEDLIGSTAARRYLCDPIMLLVRMYF